MPDAPGRRRYAWLADVVNNDGTILTASRRLARELRAAFNEQQMECGAEAWTTPQIWYWQDWTRGLLLAVSPPGATRILGPNASAVLWEQCLRDHLDSEILGFGMLTRQAATAWQRLTEWQVPLLDIERSAGSRDERVFAKAARDYQAILAARGWLDNSQLAAAAVEHIVAGCPGVPAHAVMAGFDRQTPIVDALSAALNERGCETVPALLGPVSEARGLREFSDVEAELRGAGDWARKLLQSHPEAAIAIICPDLDSRADRYARLVREGLVPGWQSGGRDYDVAVDVSFGRRLADYPAVAAALLMLRWIGRDLPARDVSVLLRSPFIRGDDYGARAQLELGLRQMPDRQWTAASLEAALVSSNSGATDFMDSVRHIASLQSVASEQRALSEWAELIDETLTVIGWPGADAFDSVEFQLINRWRELLNELAILELVVPVTTLTDAVARLGTLARDTVFQPESRYGLVTLLGPLEAAGMEFDYAWIAGMDANHWPAPGNPLALVSRRLQRDYRMPDSTPTETLESSRRILNRLVRSSGQIAFSWARLDDDATQLASPLLDEFAMADSDAGADPGWYASSVAASAELFEVTDESVPSVDGRQQVAGGAGTIDAQWREPFIAFVQGRLGVRNLQRFVPGLSARVRGELLHDALFQLFRDTPDQDTIRAWQDADRRRRIDRALDRAFRKVERHADSVLRRLLALERARLRLLLNEFIDTELCRSRYQIDRVEEKIRFSHAGVELSLRADRIDRLPDGSLLIIDYKSGARRNLLDKDGEPIEPQVVVYAAAESEPVGGLALININRRAIEYKGAGSGVEGRRFEADEWQSTLRRWQADVLTAMEEIAAGDARVLLYPGARGHGQLGVLSRFEELRRD